MCKKSNKYERKLKEWANTLKIGNLSTILKCKIRIFFYYNKKYCLDSESVNSEETFGLLTSFNLYLSKI
jgi:hypothetical protein